MTSRDTGSGFLIGFVVGAVVGLSVGFLYAPRSGEETRELLKEKLEVAKEKTSEVATRIKGAAVEAKRKAQEAL